MTATTRTPVRCRLVGARDPVVGAAWRRLQVAGGVTTPFHSWQWFTALTTRAATGAGVRVAVVTDDGAVIGLLPFECVRDHRGLRVVGPPAASWLAPDHLEVVAAPPDRVRVATSVATALARARDHDAIDFDGVGAHSALHHALDDVLRAPRYLRRAAAPTVLPCVDLTTRPTEHLLSRNSRKQVRRALRAAEAAGGGFAVHTDAASVTAHLPELMDLHDARFGAASAIYAGSARRSFHLRAAALLADAGLVRLYRLATAEHGLALLYALAWGDRLLAYGGGIRASAGTPGHALTGLVLADAAREGFAVLDLLRGDSDWKRRVASGRSRNHRVHGYAVGPGPLACQARWLARRTVLRARARADLRPA